MSKIDVTFKSRAEVQSECRQWAKDISESYPVDAIVFVAKSGFLFAEAMADELGVPMADISASRPGNDNKDRIVKAVPKMPRFLLAFLLKSKMQISYNKGNSERNVVVSDRLKRLCEGEPKRVLIVDDSVDTGWTILKVKEELARMVPDADIKVAGYCVLDSSSDLVKTDYYRYRNMIVVTATSRYSSEYREFVNSYETWKKS